MATITNTYKNTQTWPYKGAAVLRLAPGDTDVTSEQLKGLNGHPVFRDFVKKKILLVTLNEEEQDEAALERLAAKEKAAKEQLAEEDAKKEDGFEGLSQRELVKRISELTDRDQLEQLAQDGRPRVAEAAKQQLASL